MSVGDRTPTLPAIGTKTVKAAVVTCARKSIGLKLFFVI